MAFWHFLLLCMLGVAAGHISFKLAKEKEELTSNQQLNAVVCIIVLIFVLPVLIEPPGTFQAPWNTTENRNAMVMEDGILP
jgi:ABC-type amino acid transport system permease subunit